MESDDLVALVTGASSGLGRGLACRLAEEGFAVGLVAPSAVEPDLRAVAGRILDAGGRVAVAPADVSDRAMMRRAVDEVTRQLGPVDLLVANAGVKPPTEPGHVDASEVETVLSVNFLGAAYAVEAVLPGMKERGDGHLVCTSSIAAYGGLPGGASYCASKAALTSFFEALRIELRGSGVDVTILSPGFVRTGMTGPQADRRPFLLEADDAVERMLRAILGRKRAYSFPWPTAFLARAGRLLPRSIYDAILQGKR